MLPLLHGEDSDRVDGRDDAGEGEDLHWGQGHVHAVPCDVALTRDHYSLMLTISLSHMVVLNGYSGELAHEVKRVNSNQQSSDDEEVKQRTLKCCFYYSLLVNIC